MVGGGQDIDRTGWEGAGWRVVTGGKGPGMGSSSSINNILPLPTLIHLTGPLRLQPAKLLMQIGVDPSGQQSLALEQG